jgi:hypothetical protein
LSTATPQTAMTTAATQAMMKAFMVVPLDNYWPQATTNMKSRELESSA